MSDEQVTVELVESEWIVRRGARRVTWQVRTHSAWIAAIRWPGACVQSLSSSPGVVWERRVVIHAAVGALVRKTDSWPAGRAAHSPLDHLLGGRSTGRRLARSEYTVGPKGKLVPKTGS